MTTDVVSAEVLALASASAGRPDPSVGPGQPVLQGSDRSPQSLAVLLAKAAERLRTDPGENFGHCAVRGAAEVLRVRLHERMGGSWEATKDEAEKP